MFQPIPPAPPIPPALQRLLGQMVRGRIAPPQPHLDLMAQLQELGSGIGNRRVLRHIDEPHSEPGRLQQTRPFGPPPESADQFPQAPPMPPHIGPRVPEQNDAGLYPQAPPMSPHSGPRMVEPNPLDRMRAELIQATKGNSYSHQQALVKRFAGNMQIPRRSMTPAPISPTPFKGAARRPGATGVLFGGLHKAFPRTPWGGAPGARSYTE